MQYECKLMSIEWPHKLKILNNFYMSLKINFKMHETKINVK